MSKLGRNFLRSKLGADCNFKSSSSFSMPENICLILHELTLLNIILRMLERLLLACVSSELIFATCSWTRFSYSFFSAAVCLITCCCFSISWCRIRINPSRSFNKASKSIWGNGGGVLVFGGKSGGASKEVSTRFSTVDALSGSFVSWGTTTTGAKNRYFVRK